MINNSESDLKVAAPYSILINSDDKNPTLESQSPNHLDEEIQRKKRKKEIEVNLWDTYLRDLIGTWLQEIILDVLMTINCFLFCYIPLGGLLHIYMSDKVEYFIEPCNFTNMISLEELRVLKTAYMQIVCHY